MYTHNLCFEQKYEKYNNFSSENYHFYSREMSQYIAWTCLRNEKNNGAAPGLIKAFGGLTCKIVTFVMLWLLKQWNLSCLKYM